MGAVVIIQHTNGEKLTEKNQDHPFIGNYAGKREFHITLGWLLIYEIGNGNLILYLTRIGKHSFFLICKDSNTGG